MVSYCRWGDLMTFTTTLCPECWAAWPLCLTWPSSTPAWWASSPASRWRAPGRPPTSRTQRLATARRTTWTDTSARWRQVSWPPSLTPGRWKTWMWCPSPRGWLALTPTLLTTALAKASSQTPVWSNQQGLFRTPIRLCLITFQARMWMRTKACRDIFLTLSIMLVLYFHIQKK